MVGQTIILPFGYLHDDIFYRDVLLESVTGLVEDMIQDKTKSPAYRTTQLLSGCTKKIGIIAPITPDIIRNLSVIDRDFLLFKLREITFGSMVEFYLTCPNSNCREKMNVDFDIHSLIFERGKPRGPYYTVRIDNTAIEFRLPNGGDLEFVGDWAARDPSRAEALIFKRCIRSINEKRASESEIDNLTQKSKDAIQKRMEELDPLTDLNIQAVCPECGNEFLAPFDIQEFFLSELVPNSDVFYREVHYLAYYYHWSKEEILSLPRWKRKKYIEFIINELS